MHFTHFNFAAAALVAAAAVKAAPPTNPRREQPAAAETRSGRRAIVQLYASDARKKPDYSKCTTSKRILFTEPETNYAYVQGINFTIPGNPTIYQAALDTGSMGFKVHPEQIPNWKDIVKDERKAVPTHMFYVSDYLLVTGFSYNSSIGLPDVDMETDPVQLFVQTWQGSCTAFNTLSSQEQAVTSECPGVPASIPSRNYTPPTVDPMHWGYMGTGFSRVKWGTPNFNDIKLSPLLNIAKINGTPVDKYCQGYAFTEYGIDVGITADVIGGYKMIKLDPNAPRAGDFRWSQPPVAYKFGSGNWRYTELLVDTGIPFMYINWVPAGYALGSLSNVTSAENPQRSMIEGTPVSVRIGNNMTTVFHYDFRARSEDRNYADNLTTILPPKVSVTMQDGEPGEVELMNTGSLILRENDMFIDNTNGWWGMRQRPAMSEAEAAQGSW